MRNTLLACTFALCALWCAPAVQAQADTPASAPVVSAPAADPAPAAVQQPAPPSKPSLVPAERINGADTAWLMTATALVLLMTLPGIALFYGGMVRRKSVINTMASVLGITTVVSLLWFLLAYSLAFTPGTSFLGGFARAGFAGMEYLKDAGQVAVSHLAPSVPEPVYALFQLTFAIITAALVVGAVVERMRFSALLLFISSWTLVVYAPIAHWVWEPGGWLATLGVLDFAGGSVVHINAGVTGLVCAYALGPRRGYGREAFEPYNLAFTMCGAGLLWIGWFGFNGGSALAADGRAGLAMVVTHIAAAAGAAGWMLGEAMLRGRASLLGLCSGLVAGLVAITPASGFVTPLSALIIGALAGVVCYWGATGLKRLLQADDSLDVFGVHAVGGIVGSLLTGVFASKAVGGVAGNLPVQLLGVAVVALYAAVASAILLLVTHFIVGLRVSQDAETTGLDLALHRERIGT